MGNRRSQCTNVSQTERVRLRSLSGETFHVLGGDHQLTTGGLQEHGKRHDVSIDGSRQYRIIPLMSGGSRREQRLLPFIGIEFRNRESEGNSRPGQSWRLRNIGHALPSSPSSSFPPRLLARIEGATVPLPLARGDREFEPPSTRSAGDQNQKCQDLWPDMVFRFFFCQSCDLQVLNLSGPTDDSARLASPPGGIESAIYVCSITRPLEQISRRPAHRTQ